MQDAECVRFLQWALPRLHLRWPGFRKVRKQVCKRLARRLNALHVEDLDAYQQFLSEHPEEWHTLDGLCRVVITRFYRDKLVFAKLVEDILPQLAVAALESDREKLRVWSVGSASGEEAYTLAMLWEELLAPRYSQLRLAILGTEIDPCLLERCRQACYPASAVKNLPAVLRDAAFTKTGEVYCLKPRYQTSVRFEQQDIRASLPGDMFDLILCRNLVFTYFDEPLQRSLLQRLLARLRPGGWLVVGVHEKLPVGVEGVSVVSERLGLYRK
jgi:chemotaxis protein methyltransferase CheR